MVIEDYGRYKSMYLQHPPYEHKSHYEEKQQDFPLDPPQFYPTSRANKLPARVKGSLSAPESVYKLCGHCVKWVQNRKSKAFKNTGIISLYCVFSFIVSLLLYHVFYRVHFKALKKRMQSTVLYEFTINKQKKKMLMLFCTEIYIPQS